MINYSYKMLTSKDIRIQIGQRLHEERCHAHISLDKLAELTGFSKPTVQRWEKGWKKGTGENVIPTLDQIIELCSIYKCSPGYLLCEYDERTRQSFDASLELGLTEETVNLLQELTLKQVDNLHPSSGNLFLCFLNYLICNSSYLSNLLEDRFKIISGDRLMMSGIPGMDIAKKAFSDPDVQRQLLQVRAFSNKDIMDDTEKKKLMDILSDYYSREVTDSKYSPSFLASAAMQYCNYIFPTSEKQSDFIISETFLDIIKDFYDKAYNELDNYNRFVDKQKRKKAELDPNFYSHLHYAIFQ